MKLKDYYSILELPPSATTEEIKKAYRRLAHQYHPDKQQDDTLASAQFSIIKEAYETLTNPVRKEHYLQQRWYAKSMGQKGDIHSRSPVAVLQQLLELERYTSRLDAYRLDKPGLSDYLLEIFSTDTIELINTFRDDTINDQLVTTTLKLIDHLTPPLAVRLYIVLEKIAPVDRYAAKIGKHRAQNIRRAKWEGQKIWLLLVTVAAICLLIIFTS